MGGLGAPRASLGVPRSPAAPLIATNLLSEACGVAVFGCLLHASVSHLAVLLRVVACCCVCLIISEFRMMDLNTLRVVLPCTSVVWSDL